MTEIRNHDRYLDPPSIPEYAECDGCHEKFHADDLVEHRYKNYCEDCLNMVEAEEQERE